MQKWMAIPIGLLGLFILIILFELPLNAVHNIQTEEQTDPDLAITGTPPAGMVTLTEDLWQANVASVLSIVGDVPADTITAVSYAEATKVLTMTGVGTSTTATVKYEIDGLTEWTGFGPIVAISPLLLWLAMIGTCLFLVISGALSLRGP